MFHFLKLMLQLLLSPARGWEDVAEHSDGARRVFVCGLLPLMALSALSVVVWALYQPMAMAVGDVVIRMIATFFSYFIAYFLGLFVMVSVLPRLSPNGKIAEESVHLFMIYTMAMMCCINVLANVLPMQLTLLQFLPLYVWLVMCRGARFMNVPDQQMMKFVVLTFAAVLVPVFLMQWLQESIIPSA
jgi:hypothetical protein